jgi:hypothetical protein
VIFRVSLNTIPLVVISPTVRALSADTIVLPERRNAVDNVATFLIIVFWGQADKHLVTLAFNKMQTTIVSNITTKVFDILDGICLSNNNLEIMISLIEDSLLQVIHVKLKKNLSSSQNSTLA